MRSTTGSTPTCRPDAPRWAFSGIGDYALPRGFIADFDANIVSDDDFLKQFDYSDADQLTSEIRVRRTREKDSFSLAAIAFQNLLPDDDGVEDAPAILPDFAYRRQIARPAGRRPGLDRTRRARRRARRRRQLVPRHRRRRLAARVDAAARAAPLRARRGGARRYQVSGSDSATDGLLNRFTPDASLELRWPFVRRDASADQIIEPIAQLVYSDSFGETDVPNEDSTLPEFSYSNLFSLNRFPGRDRLETGLRANLGVQYTRDDPDGWSLGLTFGRVLRATDLDAVSRRARASTAAGRTTSAR